MRGRAAAAAMLPLLLCPARVASLAVPRLAARAQHARCAGPHLAAAPALPKSSLPLGDDGFAIAILGDLHIDPRDETEHMEGQTHMRSLLQACRAQQGNDNLFVASLGDLGESKDCSPGGPLGGAHAVGDEWSPAPEGELYAGTTACFKRARRYLDGFTMDDGLKVPWDVVGGNHDLEGLEEFETDAENLEAYLRILGKETPQYCYEVAQKTLIVGLGSTTFRDAPYTSHEVVIDDAQVEWFEALLKAHPAADGWSIFCFTHAPIVGSAIRVLQENHVINGCCWLNHSGDNQKFIKLVRENPSIKAWFSGHFHLSHDYEDSITVPDQEPSTNRGSCVFGQTGVMATRSTRDGRRQSRFIRGNEFGFEVCTVNHAKGGELRVDATITCAPRICPRIRPNNAHAVHTLRRYADECDISGPSPRCSVVTFAHPSEDYDHDLWFKVYTPRVGDGCYLEDNDGALGGVINTPGSKFADITSNPEVVCWWHMKDKEGQVIGAHNGMLLEYDATSLAPLGVVCTADELAGRQVAVIDDGVGSTLLLYDEGADEVTVVQPNEDGSYWRKLVRNKMKRTREMKRQKAAAKWLQEQRPDADSVRVYSAFGPYLSPKPLFSTAAHHDTAPPKSMPRIDYVKPSEGLKGLRGKRRSLEVRGLDD